MHAGTFETSPPDSEPGEFTQLPRQFGKLYREAGENFEKSLLQRNGGRYRPRHPSPRLPDGYRETPGKQRFFFSIQFIADESAI